MLKYNHNTKSKKRVLKIKALAKKFKKGVDIFMNNNIKTFDMLKVSSKIGICGLPLRMDTYSGCSFGCTYCFANNREIMKSSGFKVGNVNKLKNHLLYIYYFFPPYKSSL